MPTAPKPAKATSPERVGLRRAILGVLQALPVNRSVLHTSRNLPRSAAVGLVESGTPKGTGGADGIQSVGKLAPCYSEHTSLKQRGHLKLQLAPASSQIKTHQNSRLNLVENAGQVPSSGEIPPFGGRMPASSDLDIPKVLPPTQAEPDLPPESVFAEGNGVAKGTGSEPSLISSRPPRTRLSGGCSLRRGRRLSPPLINSIREFEP
jgi:hypothetical protein